MNEVETEARLSTLISMITDIHLPPSMLTYALTAIEIGLPDTPVIWTIYIAPDVDDDSDEIVYNSDGKAGPSYEQYEDKGGLNPPEEELVDTKIATERTGQEYANNAPPELTLAATTTMTVKVIKEHMKAQNLIVWGNKPDILLRLRQAIEANVPIVTGLDPNILDTLDLLQWRIGN